MAKGTKNYYLRDGTGGIYKAKAEEKKESRARNSIQQIFLLYVWQTNNFSL